MCDCGTRPSEGVADSLRAQNDYAQILDSGFRSVAVAFDDWPPIGVIRPKEFRVSLK
jgi:hypothetical protein